MAPEMFASPDGTRPLAASRTTDVFALGTLLFEILTGTEPWRELVRGAAAVADPSAARLARVRAGEMLDMARLPADVPPAIASLLHSCLALDRAARPRMARVRAVLEQAHDEFVGGKFDIFLSHAWGKGDCRKAFTDQIYFALKEHGLRVWLDSNEMKLNLRASMADGIAKSELVLALLSPDYQRSRQCMYELRFSCGADAEEFVQREALTARLDAARAALAAAQALADTAEREAQRATTEATTKVAKLQRSLNGVTAAGDEHAVEIFVPLVAAAVGDERRVRW